MVVMALVAFLRGANVGGHRTFRPSVVAKELCAFDVVNVGAAGTFVARKPGTRARFRAALLERLPFETQVVVCNGADLLRVEARNPFGDEPVQDGVVRFVTVLAKADGIQSTLPVAWPPVGDWLVRVVASEGPFVFGMYRRDVRTIRYLGQVEKLYHGPATTRNWNTIAAVVRILKGDAGRVGPRSSPP